MTMGLSRKICRMRSFGSLWWQLGLSFQLYYRADAYKLLNFTRCDWRPIRPVMSRCNYVIPGQWCSVFFPFLFPFLSFNTLLSCGDIMEAVRVFWYRESMISKVAIGVCYKHRSLLRDPRALKLQQGFSCQVDMQDYDMCSRFSSHSELGSHFRWANLQCLHCAYAIFNFSYRFGAMILYGKYVFKSILTWPFRTHRDHNPVLCSSLC